MNYKFQWYSSGIKTIRPSGYISLKQLINSIISPKPEMLESFRLIAEAGARGDKEEKDRLKGVVKYSLEKEHFDIQKYEHFVSLSLPENLLKRGYTITTRNGKIIKSVFDIVIGDTIQTRFSDGEVGSKIVDKK